MMELSTFRPVRSMAREDYALLSEIRVETDFPNVVVIRKVLWGTFENGIGWLYQVVHRLVFHVLLCCCVPNVRGLLGQL